MFRAAIGFFIFGIFAMLLGANGIAGLSMEIGRTVLFVFIALAVISLLGGLITGRRPKSLT